MQNIIDMKDQSRKSSVCSRKNNQNASSSESKEIFEIMFIRNDDDQSVEVYESLSINFGDVIDQLNRGCSVFIKQKICPEYQQNQKRQPTKQSRYIAHM